MRNFSPLGKWEEQHADAVSPKPYGDPHTYKIGAEFLADCELIEDWGCGLGWFETLMKPGQVRNIDGSKSRFVGEVVDLENYHSSVPGIFMRHVLEHNWSWKVILRNAIGSAQRKLCVVLFTPWSDGPTANIAVEPLMISGVPDLAFNREEFLTELGGLTRCIETHATATVYRIEHVIKICKSK